jgi:hypothetical protein
MIDLGEVVTPFTPQVPTPPTSSAPIPDANVSGSPTSLDNSPLFYADAKLEQRTAAFAYPPQQYPYAEPSSSMYAPKTTHTANASTSTTAPPSVSNVTSVLSNLSLFGNRDRRSLVVPEGLTVFPSTNGLSVTVVHGLDKQRFDPQALRIISAAAIKSANVVEFKSIMCEAGLLEIEAAEIWLDIKCYPADVAK